MRNEHLVVVHVMRAIRSGASRCVANAFADYALSADSGNEARLRDALTKELSESPERAEATDCERRNAARMALAAWDSGMAPCRVTIGSIVIDCPEDLARLIGWDATFARWGPEPRFRELAQALSEGLHDEAAVLRAITLDAERAMVRAAEKNAKDVSQNELDAAKAHLQAERERGRRSYP